MLRTVVIVLVGACLGACQDIDIDASIIEAINDRYRKDRETLTNIFFKKEHNDREWPPTYPPFKIHTGTVVYTTSTSSDAKSVTALDQWYENRQRNNELTVNLKRSVERSSTITSQIMRGIRSTFKADVSLSLPSLGASGPGVGVKGAIVGSFAIDVRERTTQTETKMDTFTIDQTLRVPPRKSVHVLWVILEKEMVVKWTAVLHLEGYVMTKLRKTNGLTYTRLERVCDFADPLLNDIVKVNRTTCKVTVEGFTKVHGGMESKVTTKDIKINKGDF